MAGIFDVVVDDREPMHFIKLFEDVGAGSVRVERLKVGDFLVNQRWIFERKTIADFCASLVDGRLFLQAARMLQSSGLPIIILEGGSRQEVEKLHVKREAIQGALITLSVFFNIPVLRAMDAEEAVSLINYTVTQEERFGKKTAKRYGYRPKRKRARQLFVLEGLPGVGRDKAAKLLDNFGSVEAVVTAAADELAAVDGIGTVTAQRIRNILS